MNFTRTILSGLKFWVENKFSNVESDLSTMQTEIEKKQPAGNYVTAIEGKGLSTEDYTTEEKNNLQNVVDTFATRDYVDESKPVKVSELENDSDYITVSELPTPDWNAKEGEAGYVANRTHYVGTSEKIEFAKTIEFEDHICEIWEDSIWPDFLNWKNLYIRINGVEYPFERNGYVPLYGVGVYGNPKLLKDYFGTNHAASCDGDDNGLCFAYSCTDSHGVWGFATESGIIEVEVFEKAEAVVPLDEKYIPNSIARVNQIPESSQPDWNANEGEAGYVKNRTHYAAQTKTQICYAYYDAGVASYMTITVENVGDFVSGDRYLIEFKDSNGDKETQEVIAGDTGLTFIFGGTRTGFVNHDDNGYFVYDSEETMDFADIQYREQLNVYKLEEEVKQLDSKFLATNTPAANQQLVTDADGNAVWEEKLAYENVDEVILIDAENPITTNNCTFYGDADEFACTIPAFGNEYVRLIEGETYCYRVEYKTGDIVEREFIAGKYGNSTITIIYSDENTPVRITNNSSNYRVYFSGGYDIRDTISRLTIKHVSIQLKPLDEKFIPDTIARVEDIPTELSDLSADSDHRTVTDTEKEAWNAKSNFSGSYNDLTNKPTIPSISGLASETFVGNKVNELRTEIETNVLTIEEIDEICGSSIVMASEVEF